MSRDSLVSARHAAQIVCVVMLFLSAAASAPAQTRPDLRWLVGGHSFGINDARYSPDGSLIVSASNDGTSKVWRTSDGRLLHSIDSALLEVFAHACSIFSPDGADVITTGTGGAYRWRMSDGALLQDYFGLETGYDAAYSPDGLVLAVGGSISGTEEAVILFDAADGSVLRTIVVNQLNYVISVAFTPDGQTLIVGVGSPFGGQSHGFVRYFRLSDGVETHTLSDHTGRVNRVVLSPDGTILASASEDGTVRLWNASSATHLRTLSGHVGEVSDAAFSPDGLHIAATGVDGTVRVWDVATGSFLFNFVAHDGPAGTIEWSADGTRLLTGAGRFSASTDDISLRIWNASNGEPIGQITEYNSTVEVLARSADGSLLATGDTLGTIQIRAASDGSLVRSIVAPPGLTALAFSPDDEVLASGGFDDNVTLWNVANGQLIRTITGHTSTIGDIAFSLDGQTLASACWNDSVHLWDPVTGELLDTFPGDMVRTIVFSPDGVFLAGGGNGTVALWRLSDGSVEHTLTGHISAVRDVAFSPDGTMLASGGTDRDIRLWRVADGMHLLTLSGHSHWVRSVRFSPDGQTLASGSGNQDRTLRLWRVSDGAPLVLYDDEVGRGVRGVAFSPDGLDIYYICFDGALAAAVNPLARPIGDIDADGDVDLDDAAAFVNVLIGTPLESAHIHRSDLDESGSPDGRDVDEMIAALLTP